MSVKDIHTSTHGYLPTMPLGAVLTRCAITIHEDWFAASGKAASIVVVACNPWRMALTIPICGGTSNATEIVLCDILSVTMDRVAHVPTHFSGPRRKQASLGNSISLSATKIHLL